ncbi:MAG: response regulator transcription factor [Acidobacteria bacterium]|nr:response regulator transcription factor [Acidobacteriota bacterium]
MIKVLVADDHPIFREGLKKIIEEAPDMEVVDEAADGEETLRKLRDDDFDLIIMDICMPGKSGLEILEQIKEEKPDLPVLILSMYTEEKYAQQAFNKGASEYLTKLRASSELISAIRRVLLNKHCLGSVIDRNQVFSHRRYKDLPCHEKLSKREYQVFILITSGKKTIEIAEELSISVKTVGTYRKSILEKIGVNTPAELTRYAIENNLLH